MQCVGGRYNFIVVDDGGGGVCDDDATAIRSDDINKILQHY